MALGLVVLGAEIAGEIHFGEAAHDGVGGSLETVDIVVLAQGGADDHEAHEFAHGVAESANQRFLIQILGGRNGAGRGQAGEQDRLGVFLKRGAKRALVKQARVDRGGLAGGLESGPSLIQETLGGGIITARHGEDGAFGGMLSGRRAVDDRAPSGGIGVVRGLKIGDEFLDVHNAPSL